MYYSDSKTVNDPLDPKKQLKIRLCFIEISHYEVFFSFTSFLEKYFYFYRKI